MRGSCTLSSAVWNSGNWAWKKPRIFQVNRPLAQSMPRTRVMPRPAGMTFAAASKSPRSNGQMPRRQQARGCPCETARKGRPVARSRSRAASAKPMVADSRASRHSCNCIARIPGQELIQVLPDAARKGLPEFLGFRPKNSPRCRREDYPGVAHKRRGELRDFFHQITESEMPWNRASLGRDRPGRRTSARCRPGPPRIRSGRIS